MLKCSKKNIALVGAVIQCESAINFDQHYTIILADLLGMWFAWHHDGDLIVFWNFCGACHGTIEELSWKCYGTGSLPAWIPTSYAQRSGRNCEIMLAEFILHLTTPVTWLCWPAGQRIRNAKYKKLCITIVGLHHLWPNYCLFITGICMPISRL